MNILIRSFLFFIFVIFSITTTFSQNDSTSKMLNELSGDIKILKKVKFTGFIQFQGQYADSTGISNYAGGDFTKGSNSRFMVRRGRFKFIYNSSPLAQFAFQIDVSEKGVSTKDIFAKFTLPFFQSLSITGGIYTRPFGYELDYTTTLRESPEEARMTQIFFPGERDLGAMLTLQAPKSSPLSFLKLDAGLFNGSGNTVEYDKYKDIIARLNASKSFFQDNLKISGDISVYYGGFANASSKLYEVGIPDGKAKQFIITSSNDSLKRDRRQLLGLDMQIAFINNPMGTTTLKGEYIGGNQPAFLDDNTSPTKMGTGPTYIRKVESYCAYFIQNIAKTKHKIVIKYDSFDPNTKVTGNAIGVSGSNFSKADIKYTTLGIGWIYDYDANLRIMLYRDFVKNEATSLTKYTRDITDNFTTLRFQYKF